MGELKCVKCDKTADVSDIRAWLRDTKHDSQVNCKAKSLLLLSSLQPSKADALLELVRCSPDRLERYSAAKVLGILGFQAVVEPLCAMLDASAEQDQFDDVWLTVELLRAVGHLADTRALETILRYGEGFVVIPFDPENPFRMPRHDQALESVKRYSFGSAIASAMAVFGDGRAIPALVRMIYDQEPMIRWTASEALVECGEAGIATCIGIIKDQTMPEVLRGDVIYGLTWCDHPQIIVCLEEIRKDFNPVVCTAADKALTNIRSFVSYERSTSSEGNGNQVSFDPLFVNLIMSGLLQERVPAIDKLGQLGDRRAIEPLVLCLRSATSPVRRAIENALGRFGVPAVARLTSELSDDRPLVRARAGHALEKIADPSAGNRPFTDVL